MKAIIQLWELPPDNNPVLQHSFSHDFPSPTDPSAPAPEEADEDVGGAVLALAVRDGTIFAGGQAGRIAVWDVETATLVRVLVAAEVCHKLPNYILLVWLNNIHNWRH
jgi:hypothetical protein